MIANYVAAAVMAWLAGAGMGWWVGPIRLCRDIVSRQTTRRSAGGDSAEPTPPAVMTDTRDPELPHRSVVLQRPLDGPRPLDELLGERGSGAEDDLSESWWLPAADESRQGWVARMMAAGQASGWIDETGADYFAVTARTFARDRKDIREQQGIR